jgi:hypothetical protein
LLRWYGEQFDHYLAGGARVMVIGYSFGDPHINASLKAAATKGMKVFIIDPTGSGVLDKRTGMIKPARDELMEALQPCLIGASRRPLTAIFGHDIIEHQRVMMFFNW